MKNVKITEKQNEVLMKINKVSNKACRNVLYILECAYEYPEDREYKYELRGMTQILYNLDAITFEERDILRGEKA